MKNQNPIHAINKISSINDNLEYYANEHKDELKGEFIGERQITGIGKKCLKLDNDFVNWDDIDEQYLNYIDGTEVTGEMEEIITFFLSQTEFITGLNSEFEEKFGTTITAPETENNTEHRELALVQVGTVINCRVFKLNQRVDRDTWKMISKHFKYYNYYDLIGCNNGEYCCDEEDLETVRKILGITAETEYLTDNREQEKIIEDITEQCEYNNKQIIKTIMDDDGNTETWIDFKKLKTYFRNRLKTGKYQIDGTEKNMVFIELCNHLLQEGYTIKQLGTKITFATLLKVKKDLTVSPKTSDYYNPFMKYLRKALEKEEVKPLEQGHKAYTIACKILEFLKEKETVTYDTEDGRLCHILIDSLEKFIHEQKLEKYIKPVGQTIQDLGYMIIDNTEERNTIDFSQDPFDNTYTELVEKQQEIRQQYIDHEIMYSQINPVYLDFGKENKKEYAIIKERTKWDKSLKAPTYYVNHDNKEIWVVNSWTKLFQDRLGTHRNYDGITNFPEENQSASGFKVDYDELLWKQILRYSQGVLGEVNLAIQLKDSKWHKEPFGHFPDYNILGKLDILSYEKYLHEREIDADIEFWEQEELSEMYDEEGWLCDDKESSQ